MFIETMQDLFDKISVQLHKPLILKEKCQLLLQNIGGEWYKKKLRCFHLIKTE